MTVEGGKRVIAAVRRVWLAVALLLLTSAASLAQDTGQKAFDFTAWETTATRAEGIIKTAEASTPSLETLRSTLVDYRSAADTAKEAGQTRIDTLQAQIDALGPAPGKGVTEPADIATRRAQLTQQLAKAKAPSLAAKEAYQRAAGLVSEIDAIIRNRLASQFLSLGPSPLNPALWGEAIDSVYGFSDSISKELSKTINSPTRMVEVRQNLPATLILLLIGILLLTRARNWVLLATNLVPRAAREALNDSRQLLVSLSQFAVPMLGIWAIVRAFDGSGLDGYRSAVLISALPMMGVALFGASWLGRTLFDGAHGAFRFFDMDDSKLRRARIGATLMGVVLALDILLTRVAGMVGFSDKATVVLSFPIVVAGGLLLFRMGMMLHPHRPVDPDAVIDNPLKQNVSRLIAKIIVLVGVLGPVLAAVGYLNAAASMVFPAIKTLALLGAAMLAYSVLTKFAEGLSAAGRVERETGKGQGEVNSSPTMVPVFVGFLLICIAAPVLALIWGARVADLQDMWTVVNDGFTIGGRRISAMDFVAFAAVFAVGYTATRLLQSALRTSVLPRTKMDSGGRNAVLTGTGYVGIFLSALAAITSAGLDLSSIALVAGALSVGIGFGLQAIVSNFVSGIILLVERPIKEGDWVEVGAASGYVRKISVRATEIETFDRANVLVPNADFITGAVTNWTHSNMNGRVKVPVGVAYASDPREVEAILLDIAKAHPMLDRRTNPNVVFLGFGADSMDFEVRLIIKDVNWVLSVKSDINFDIVERFRAANIEIPFAQRDVNLRNIDQIATAFGGKKPKAKT